MILIYNIVFTLLLVAASPFLVIILLFNRKWSEGIAERFSMRFPGVPGGLAGKKVVWFHAASAGEVQALVPVIKEFKTMNAGAELVVTTTSLNGRKKIEKELSGVIAGAVLMPLDIAFIINPFIDSICPEALVVVETELWPNMLSYASDSGAAIIMINGRISIKSFRFYYAMRFFFKKVLSVFDVLIVQSEKMVKRLSRLGVARSKLIILNNTKYSFEVNSASLEALTQIDKKGKKLVIAGSIREGEEEFVIDGFMKAEKKEKLLIFAPRHLKRVAATSELLRAKALKYCLWSSLKDKASITDYDAVIVDTIGELSYIYTIGDVAVIGGGFREYGGHNPMEAAVAGLPLIMGKHMFNFEDTADKFLKEGGAFQVETSDELGAKLSELLASDGMRSYIGEKNRRIIEKFRGSAATTAMLINEILIDRAKGRQGINS
jgi:3-deoxy-D-manno-octulosonic-acid transferase